MVELAEELGCLEVGTAKGFWQQVGQRQHLEVVRRLAAVHEAHAELGLTTATMYLCQNLAALPTRPRIISGVRRAAVRIAVVLVNYDSFEGFTSFTDGVEYRTAFCTDSKPPFLYSNQ